MKKLYPLLLLSLLILFLGLSSRQVSAAEIVSNTESSTKETKTTTYPAPPLGTICGKTMCLEDEICVQYPQDKDEHCVPKSIDPAAKKADPEMLPDCWDEYGRYKGSFPPNAECWNHPSAVQNKLSAYDKTCIYQPVVQYTATRRQRSGDWRDQSFEMCGIGDSGPGGPPAPGGGDDRCYVAMLVYTDVREATLGSYGPSKEAIDTYSIDFLAQNYLYNSLFARPENLSDTNREAYRTYWRLLPAANQANLRSYVMNMAHQNLIEDINFEFNDTNGSRRQTSFGELYNKLKSQVIVFLHPPFIRIGCLTDYPVCPEYAKAIKDLKTPVSELVDFVSNFPLPVDVSPAIQFYGTLSDTLNLDTSGAYSAFTPLDFSSVRGYIVKKSNEVADELYRKQGYTDKLVDNLNAPRYGGNKPSLGNVSRETLPYIGAIYQGLLSPKFGILSALQPQWLINKATSSGAIYDYKQGNFPQEFPEVKISAKNILSRITDELAAAIENPISWTLDLIFGEKEKSFSKENLLTKGYAEPRTDNEDGSVRSQYVNMQDCPLPVSYHLMSPPTANKASGDPFEGVSKDDHHQVIWISGKNIQWAYTPDRKSMEPECKPNRNNAPGCHWVYPSCNAYDQYVEGDTCFTRKWSLTAIKDGMALTVLNNPKQTDIKKAVIEDNKFSLYKTLLPDAVSKKKIADASVDAPIARNFVSYLDGGSQSATAPNGKTLMFNPAEPINRVNNRAQDTMHILQNCWTMPDKLQNSPRCKLTLEEQKPSDVCNGEAFAKIEPNPTQPSSKAQSVWSDIEGRLTDDLVKAYAEAEKQTGVPCEVLAGIHFEEADNDPNKDLQSGGDLGGRTLTESAIQAANELTAKVGKITDLNSLINALSWYNGGGNSNCQAGGSNSCASTDRCGMTVRCATDPDQCTCISRSEGEPEPGSCRDRCSTGFPYSFSYGFCPPKSTGYDDPYVTNWWISPEHDNMYLLYKHDCTATKPEIHSRPGSLTVAIMYYLSHKK